MRFLQHVVAAISMSLIAMTAGATPANPQVGVDYRLLDPAQPTDSGKKIEVTEFFWYTCPHCNAFDPSLSAWVKKQGDNIAFKRIPGANPLHQKLYYTLEAMGKLDELHSKVFHALHVDRVPLDTEEAIADFMAKQGVDRKKFLELFNSFSVQTKVRRGAQLTDAYKIDGVPTLVVDGRFVTSPSIVSTGANIQQPESLLHSMTLQTLDSLIAKARADKAPVAEAKPAMEEKAASAPAKKAKKKATP